MHLSDAWFEGSVIIRQVMSCPLLGLELGLGLRPELSDTLKHYVFGHIAHILLKDPT